MVGGGASLEKCGFVFAWAEVPLFSGKPHFFDMLQSTFFRRLRAPWIVGVAAVAANFFMGAGLLWAGEYGQAFTAADGTTVLGDSSALGSTPTGTVSVQGQPYAARREENHRLKVRSLPEEPLRNACVGDLSVAMNIGLRRFDQAPAARGGWLRPQVLKAMAIGKTGNSASTLSSTPPCPGSRLLLSLMPD